MPSRLCDFFGIVKKIASTRTPLFSFPGNHITRPGKSLDEEYAGFESNNECGRIDIL